MPEGVCPEILGTAMLHDVVLCKDPEYMMRNLPIKMMEPVSILFADLVGFTAMSSTVWVYFVKYFLVVLECM